MEVSLLTTKKLKEMASIWEVKGYVKMYLETRHHLTILLPLIVYPKSKIISFHLYSTSIRKSRDSISLLVGKTPLGNI